MISAKSSEAELIIPVSKEEINKGMKLYRKQLNVHSVRRLKYKPFILNFQKVLTGTITSIALALN